MNPFLNAYRDTKIIFSTHYYDISIYLCFHETFASDSVISIEWDGLAGVFHSVPTHCFLILFMETMQKDLCKAPIIVLQNNKRTEYHL